MADLEESHFRGSVAKDVVFADLEWDRNSSGSRLLGMERLMERFRRLIFNFEEDFRFSFLKMEAAFFIMSPLDHLYFWMVLPLLTGPL